jgi:hypothetical protein
VGVLSAVLLLATLSAPVQAVAAPCDWEWGGVAEVTPEPCDTPLVVDQDPSGYVPNAVYLGFGLVVFLGGLYVVRTLGGH